MLTQYRGTGHTLRGKWVLKGKTPLADPTSASWAEKASYHSAVCLETGEVEWMELGATANLQAPPLSCSNCESSTLVH